MTKIIATFDGLKINIEGAETATAHQLWIASERLKADSIGLERVLNRSGLAGEIIVVEFENFNVWPDYTPDIKRHHILAVAAEFAMAAQYIFGLTHQREVIQATVQMTLQAIAEQAQAQQIMAGAKVTKGGILTPH